LATGGLSLEGLAAFLPRCVALASVDSGPAHLATALGVPVLALYSGTNLAAQWGPRGRRVALLRSDTPCSPCELTDCPFQNACMAGIAVDAARAALGRLLKKA
jgi:ADP-heptose:LPS heptosyltransferase